MQIIKTDFVSGAQNARGIVVIIDVFRAFSVACYCLQQRPQRILPVGSIETAMNLKQRYPEALLIGERGGKKLPSFDFGNSPTELAAADVRGATLIHTTHAGTQGLVNAKQADLLLTGAFVNAQATADYILRQQPALVTLVRMGWQAETATDEDNLCADYLESLLLQQPLDTDVIKATLAQSPDSARFFDPALPWNPESDFELCLDIDRFDFAVRVKTDAETGLALAAVR